MKLLAIDSNSLLNRAFYGIRILSTEDGVFTNGIYGFMNIFLKLQADLKPDGVAFAFDLPAPTFRHQVFEEYKGHRKAMPEELRGQFPLLKELLRDLGYTIVECEGYEADDILGTLAAACAGRGDDCIVATGDRDSLQLVTDQVQVLLATTKMGKADYTLYTPETVQEKYGVTPAQLIDVKALMGDSSDNIPGVAGVGEKTALSLIGQFGSLEKVYAAIDDPAIKKGVREKLVKDREMAFISQNLATIETNAPVPLEGSAYLPGEGDLPAALRLLQRLELNSLIPRLIPEEVRNAPAETGEEGETPLAFVREAEHFDALELSAVIRSGERLGLLCDWEEGQLARFTVITPELYYPLEAGAEGFEQALELLCENAGKVMTYQAKPIYHWALEKGIRPGVFGFSLDLAAYVLDASAKDYALGLLCEEYKIPYDREKAGKSTDFALAFWRLATAMEEAVKGHGLSKLLTEIEDPLCLVLASMEKLGFLLDSQGLASFGEGIREDLGKIEEKIYEQAGEKFNINSPKQLGEILFEKLGLPCKKKTKTGYSTNVDVLQGLRNMHPIIDLILEYRKLSKLSSTYVEGLRKEVGEDGRIHSTFNQTETRTGRISSLEPNLQNIPVRTELGRELRKFFVAPPGRVLVDADYSQIELRVLAHIAEDETMIKAFLEHEDIHRNTAAQVFHMPPEMVTSRMRSQAKAVNFGIVYGISAYSLSEDIGVTVKEADQYIKSYLDTFGGVKQYMDETVKQGTELGYVKTLFNRIRYVPELAAKNRILQGFGKRVAMNTPIQGTAADIIKIAMVRVYRRLRDDGLDAKLILQVHDELIVEADAALEDRVKDLLREEMEQAASLRVPLEVDVHTGDTWYAAKG